MQICEGDFLWVFNSAQLLHAEYLADGYIG